MSHDSNSQEWQPCSRSEFTSLAARLDAKRQREQLGGVVRAVTVVACLAVVASAGLWAMSSKRPAGGITCEHCYAQFDTYHEHLTGSAAMPADEAHSMQVHLARCLHCREEFEARFPDIVASTLRESGEWLARPDVQLPLAATLAMW